MNTLRTTLASPGLVVAPGVYDGLSAKIARRAGCSTVYASGGAIARSMGYPDIGLVSSTEMLKRIQEIVDAAEVPVIADADTGYGNPLNVVRTVRDLERAGVAALHLEDQDFPKKCGHYDGKRVVPAAEMAQKVRAAVWARRSPDLLVIARTDARATTGLDDAIERARTYKQAGADILFVEAPETPEEIERVARELPGPLLLNMFQGGKTPVLPLANLERMGYKLVIVPSDLQRVAVRAMQLAAAALLSSGNTAGLDAISFADRDELIDKPAWDDLESRFSGS